MFLFLLLTQPMFFSYYVNTVSNIFQHKLLEISRNDERNFQNNKCWHTHQRKLLSTLWVQNYSVSGIISSFKTEEIYVFCSVGWEHTIIVQMSTVCYLFILLLKFNFRLCLKLSALFLVSTAKRMIFWKAKTAKPLMKIFVLNIIPTFSTVNIVILHYTGVYTAQPESNVCAKGFPSYSLLFQMLHEIRRYIKVILSW